MHYVPLSRPTWVHLQWSGIRRPRRFLPRRVAHFEVRGRRGLKFGLTWTPFKGIRATAFQDPLHPAPWPYWRTYARELVVKKKGGAKSPETLSPHLADRHSVVFAKLVALIEHCACVRYDDGDPRRPGWVTIRTQGSSWSVQVKDPDSACSLQAVGVTLDDALALACLLLEQEETPWEHDPWLAQSNKKGKK